MSFLPFSQLLALQLTSKLRRMRFDTKFAVMLFCFKVLMRLSVVRDRAFLVAIKCLITLIDALILLSGYLDSAVFLSLAKDCNYFAHFLVMSESERISTRKQLLSAIDRDLSFLKSRCFVRPK